jgi:uncharacterized repeat protein (TIGR02543 family)
MKLLTQQTLKGIFYPKSIFTVLVALVTVFACEVEEPVPTYTLTTSVTPSEGGKISVSPQESNYVEGSQVTLTPEPNENWVFKQWEGDATGNTNPFQLTMTANKNIVGVFVKRDYPLNIKIEGEGTVGEKIVPNPSGREYPHGTRVELNPIPKDGWVFESWGGDLTGNETPKIITVDKEKNVTVKFKRRDYPLNITITGEGTVEEKIISNPGGRSYPFQTVVELKPVPKSGWEFDGWEGDLTGIEAPKNITVDKVKNVTVKFKEILFKVNPQARILGREYWENIPYPADLYCSVFQKSTTLPSQEVQTVATSWGDFNNDGYMDIFNAGGSYDGYIRGSAAFLIWNKEKNIFEETNLFNNKSIKIIGGNAQIIIPKYFNNDDYVDLLLIDPGDEGQINVGKDEPVRIVLSDGKGGYDVVEILTTEYDSFFKIMNQRKWGGDIGDLNGDGLDDLFIACNSINYIFWGIPQLPFFKKEGRIFFASDFDNPIFNNEVGMSSCSTCADHTFGARIVDIDKDGKNDIIAFGEDRVNAYHQRIFFNKNNNGVFSNQDIIKLPLNHPTDKKAIQHLIVDDFNGDGKKDIFYYLNEMTGDKYEVRMYLQKENNNFEIDKTWSDYVSYWGATKMIYSDINNDGKKDISFKDSYGDTNEILSNNRIYNKKALLRNGDRFETKNFYNYDKFAKEIIDKFYK